MNSTQNATGKVTSRPVIVSIEGLAFCTKGRIYCEWHNYPVASRELKYGQIFAAPNNVKTEVLTDEAFRETVPQQQTLCFV